MFSFVSSVAIPVPIVILPLDNSGDQSNHPGSIDTAKGGRLEESFSHAHSSKVFLFFDYT